MLSFEKLAIKIRKAEDDMKAALSDKYPVGSHVYVQLNHQQRCMTPGTVVCHDGQGYTRVRLFTEKEPVKSIYFNRIFH